MILKFYPSKSWRRFPHRTCSPHIIRKICYGALILEAAILIRDFKSAQIHVYQEEIYQKVFTEEGSLLEQCFGVRLRVEEGVVEFYRSDQWR